MIDELVKILNVDRSKIEQVYNKIINKKQVKSIKDEELRNKYIKTLIISIFKRSSSGGFQKQNLKLLMVGLRSPRIYTKNDKIKTIAQAWAIDIDSNIIYKIIFIDDNISIFNDMKLFECYEINLSVKENICFPYNDTVLKNIQINEDDIIRLIDETIPNKIIIAEQKGDFYDDSKLIILNGTVTNKVISHDKNNSEYVRFILIVDDDNGYTEITTFIDPFFKDIEERSYCRVIGYITEQEPNEYQQEKRLLFNAVNYIPLVDPLLEEDEIFEF